MKKVTGKRVIAYLIDIIIVYLIVSLFSGIDGLNPTAKEYNNAYEEYTQVYRQYTEAIQHGASELQVIEDQLTEISYYVTLYGATITLINIVCSIIYFIVFAYYNKGQTLGMKLLKIKLVSEDKKKLTFLQVMSRSLLIYSIFTGTASFILLELASKATFLKYSVSIQALDIAIVAVSLIMMMFRKDGKGVHDMFANTLVVSSVEPKEDVKEAEYTEEVKKEPKKQIKSKNKKVK